MHLDHRVKKTGAALALTGAVAVAGLSAGPASGAPLPNRPDFRLPFACGSTISLTTYKGHNPDDKKIDMFRQGMPTGSPVLASAAGYVHESFDPGGLEIDHGNGWFTVYLHMKSRIKPGQNVARGQQIGVMSNVGTGVVHLHYEQLYNPGSKDADNEDIVRPLIQGEGPIKMDPNHPLKRKSTNCGAGAPNPTPPTPTPTTPAPTPTTPAPTPPPATPAPKKYYVTTYANAPGRATPGGKQTGTLNKGRNYVFCKVKGPKVTSGSDYNSYWLKTDLDVGPANQWVSALYLEKWGNDVAKDDNGTVIPDC